MGGILRMARFKVVLAFVVVVFACLFYKGYTDLKDCYKEQDKLNASIAQEKERGKELDKTSEEYGSPEYIEEYARSLGLVKPNEKVFRNYNDKK